MFKITIEKVTTETVKTTEWAHIGDRPYTNDDLKDSHNPDSYAGDLKNIWGDKPIEKTETKTVKMYEQTIDDIELREVILAFNGLRREP